MHHRACTCAVARVLPNNASKCRYKMAYLAPWILHLRALSSRVSHVWNGDCFGWVMAMSALNTQPEARLPDRFWGPAMQARQCDAVTPLQL